MWNPESGEFVGFCIDLLKELQREMRFNYTIYEVEDGNFGAKAGDTWNGVIGDITQGVSVQSCPN